MSDDDRPRKSWREIDKGRDHSSHRQDERPQGGRQNAQKNRSYRAALDRLFDSGKIADLVEERVPGTKAAVAGGEDRLKMLTSLKKATGRDQITKQLDAYLASYDFPEDLEILGLALEHRNPSTQLEAMERIDKQLDHEKPRRCRAMVGQLKMIRDTEYDEELVELAKKLIDRLE